MEPSPNPSFIDIHAHVVYGVDDGPRTVDDSIALLEAAAESRTADIVASPHANTEYKFDPDTVNRLVTELQDRIGDRVRIHKACDFHLMHRNVEDALKNPAKYSINGKGYLLVELSDMTIFSSTRHDFERLLKAGMKPIITHPERNSLLRQRLAELADWVRDGCYIQVTAGSLLGRFGSRAEHFAKILLADGLVHFIASDAHNVSSRPPDLRPAYEFVRKQCGKDRSQELFVENPKRALTGEEIEIGPVPDVSRHAPRANWFQRLFGMK